MSSAAMRIANCVGLLALVSAALVALAVTVLWIDHFRETVMPIPTGSYGVSRTSFVWPEHSRAERIAPEGGPGREILVWIWFPTQGSSRADAVEYMPAAWRAALNRQRGALISKVLMRDLSRVRTHLVAGGELPAMPARFPVVLIRPGLAAETLNYSALAQDLASHGYVVVGFDVPHRTWVTVFPNGRDFYTTADNDVELVHGPRQQALLQRLLSAWTADAQFVVDQLERLNGSAIHTRFAGRLDLDRLGIAGHSLGGAVAAHFCSIDERVQGRDQYRRQASRDCRTRRIESSLSVFAQRSHSEI